MKKQIFYFTGTGNCLSIARKIHNNLKDYTIHSITAEGYLAEEETEKQLIIVTPVYMHNIPYIVRDFIQDLHGTGFCSLIFAGGGELGKCIDMIEKMFSDKFISLISQFNIPMPSNYTPFGAPDQEIQKKLFNKAHSRIGEICQMISEKKVHTDDSNTSFFSRNIHPGIAYSMGYKYLSYLGKSFTVDSKCDSCGICARICPVDNIQMNENKPIWFQNCQQCYACLQWCPKEAIQYKNKTSSIERYRNPEVTLKDIMTSNTKTSRE